MSIDVNNESDFEVNELEISSQAQFVLRSLHINPAAELSVLLVDEIAMATLHEKFMDEPGPTDVLSFPMDELRAGTPDRVSEEGVLGDVVLCLSPIHILRLRRIESGTSPVTWYNIKEKKEKCL